MRVRKEEQKLGGIEKRGYHGEFNANIAWGFSGTKRDLTVIMVPDIAKAENIWDISL